MLYKRVEYKNGIKEKMLGSINTKGFNSINLKKKLALLTRQLQNSRFKHYPDEHFKDCTDKVKNECHSRQRHN